jgi:hypothetical protein
MGDIINKILISRGAPKENYSDKINRIKLLWRPIKLNHLSSKQKNIISEIRYSLSDLEKYNGISIDKRDKDSRYIDLIDQLINDISRAVSAGLIWHPLVSDFVYTHKALGSKEFFRKIRRGWATGVKRPLTINDLKFRNRLEKIAKYREEGKTWPQIRRILMEGKIISKMSCQALQKKFEKAWVEEWKKVNKKPPPIP